MADHLHDEEKHSSIRWIDDGEGGTVYVYEEYLREMERQIEWEKDMGYYNLGEVMTTWKEDGDIEVNYGLMRGKERNASHTGVSTGDQ